MNDIIQAVKDVFGTMTALGWLPIPTAIAIVTMLALRIAFEPGVLEVNTKEALAEMGKRKFYIFAGVAFITFLIQVGATRPKDAFDYCTAFGFSFGDAMLAYVVSSSSKIKAWGKNTFGIGADNGE